MNLSVSVVVPAYKAEDIIGICLQSLLGQQEKPDDYEIIVVNDASPDKTSQAVESHYPAAKAAGVNLKLLEQEKNAGPAAARNRGAFEAGGDIVIFTDSDCEPTDTWLSQMLKPFADPGIAAVKGAYLSKQPELGARFAQAEFEERYRMLESAPSVDVVFSYSAAFRRDVFNALNGFDMRYPVADNEDTDLSWRLVEAGHKAVFNPDAKLFHRHPASLYDYYRKKISRGYWRVIVYRRFPDKAVKDSYTPQSLKLQIVLAYAVMGLILPALVWPALWWVIWLLLIIFAISTLPFIRPLFSRDLALALVSPFLIFGRALAIGWGILKAIPRALRTDPLG